MTTPDLLLLLAILLVSALAGIVYALVLNLRSAKSSERQSPIALDLHTLDQMRRINDVHYLTVVALQEASTERRQQS